MSWRKIKVFFLDHWPKVAIVVSIVLMIWWPLAVLSKIDSYQRSYLIAWTSMMPASAAINAVIFVVLYSWVLQGGFAKMRKSSIKGEDVRIHWKDVIGMEGAKMEAREMVELIKDRAKLKKIGGNIIRGMLMMGPPGCGKTYLAKAMATEAGIPFLSMSGAEFVEVFVGVGASRIRQLFKKARRLAYANGGCIIFIDEVDSIGRKREMFSMGGGGQETNSTQNQLLAEMDGIGSREENVIVIGATNAPEESMDAALLRPGRFDRKIYVERPDLQEREDLFRYYLSKVKHDETLDVGRLARKAVQKSPAEIASIVKEAALIATRVKQDVVKLEHLSEAMERVDLGLKKNRKVSDEEKAITAYHETGHLIVTYLTHPTDDVFKASIIPRGSAGGVTYSLPKEDTMFRNKDWFMAEICVLIAGYVAEKVKFGVTSSGVSSDFKHAMRFAHYMVWSLGMGQTESLGDYSSIPAEQLSNSVKDKLNAETHAIIQACMKKVEDIIRRENVLFERFAKELIARQELDYDEIEAIFKEYGKSNPRVANKYIPKTT